jgi:hypothetical protein
VTREQVADWFDLDADSPYMLLVADVACHRRREATEAERALWGIEKLNTVRSDIPAVTHVDYSARIQTVRRETNPALLGDHRSLQTKDRLPRRRQHEFQRARRADCLHARRQLSLLHAHGDGRARPRNLRAFEG